MVGTVIKVLGAVATRPAKGALAFIVSVMVDAGCPIFTRVKLLSAERNLPFTKLSCEAGRTGTGV